MLQIMKIHASADLTWVMLVESAEARIFYCILSNIMTCVDDDGFEK